MKNLDSGNLSIFILMNPYYLHLHQVLLIKNIVIVFFYIIQVW